MKIITVTLGSGATAISATTLPARGIIISNNGGHAIRYGDSTTTSSKGVAVANATNSPTMLFPFPVSEDLANWYIAGTQNDVIDVMVFQ